MGNEREICLSVARILKEDFGVPEEVLIPENWDTRLTSSTIRLSGIDLIYLFFEIEKCYGIRISDRLLGNYGFNSVRGVARTVLATLQQDNYQSTR